MPALPWLIARPVAHRGLHGGGAVIENTPSAFVAAIAAGYGIECDLQVSADGEAMVFHDPSLRRLTEQNARVDSLPARELKRLDFKATKDHMITLGELCDITAGRSPLLIEMKSHFQGDCRLLEPTARTLSNYPGYAAVMSFDPLLIATLRERAPALPRGIVGEKMKSAAAPDFLSRTLRSLWGYYGLLRARPQFIAFAAEDLPHLIPATGRNVFGLPVLAWTIRTRAEERAGRRHADQIIFEGFRP
jgi:glycerophosphoryl diester phosphodiesterase